MHLSALAGIPVGDAAVGQDPRQTPALDAPDVNKLAADIPSSHAVRDRTDDLTVNLGEGLVDTCVARIKKRERSRMRTHV